MNASLRQHAAVDLELAAGHSRALLPTGGEGVRRSLTDEGDVHRGTERVSPDVNGPLIRAAHASHPSGVSLPPKGEGTIQTIQTIQAVSICRTSPYPSPSSARAFFVSFAAIRA